MSAPDDGVLPLMGWALHPSAHPHQLTHAVDRGSAVAACGIATSVHAGAWPASVAQWQSPVARCPTCARAVYGAVRSRRPQIVASSNSRK